MPACLDLAAPRRQAHAALAQVAALGTAAPVVAFGLTRDD